MLTANRQKGFGIPELLIGIALGMVIIAAAMQMLQTTLTSSKDNIKMARVEQELRQSMQMISRDLRRATTWDAAMNVTRVSMLIPLTLTGVSGSVTVSTSESNDAGIDHLADIGDKAVNGTLVYMHTDVEDYDADGDKGEVVKYTGTITAYSTGSYTVTLNQTDGHNWPAAVVDDGLPAASWSILRPYTTITFASSPSCVLFFYDYDSDEDGDLTDSGGAYEVARFGYRHDNTNGAVEIRTSSASTDTCSTASWEDLTDPDFVNVTAFTITQNLSTVSTSSGLSVGVREYTITLTGQHKTDTTVTRTLRETIRVRNDSLS
jgi:type II secretory pathway component PulJ